MVISQFLFAAYIPDLELKSSHLKISTGTDLKTPTKVCSLHTASSDHVGSLNFHPHQTVIGTHSIPQWSDVKEGLVETKDFITAGNEATHS